MICQQSVGLISRSIEGQGIPTACVVMNRDIAALTRPPRALHVRFPYGAPLGPAHDAATQRAVIEAALALFERDIPPGEIVDSEIEWPQ